MSILRHTDNLVALYTHAVGQTEVPIVLHQWCCLAAIAACVEDRVYVMKHHKPLDPSLWIMLLGPSAVGKGQAITKEMMPYLEAVGVNTFFGEVTAQALMKRMSGRKGNAKVFLVNEEAAVCIRYGPAAKDFLTHMTGIYQMPPGLTYRKAALSSGDMKATGININWLLGSTLEWAIDSIPREAIEGGFLGRILPVMVPYNLEVRIADPKRPPDYVAVRKTILRRFARLRELSGEMKVSKQARALHDHWYHTREIPTDPRLLPTWKRMDDNVWKLSQVYVLAEDEEMLLCERHMEMGIKASERLLPGAERLLEAASITPGTKATEAAKEILMGHGMMKHYELSRLMHARGFSRRDQEEALRQLKDMGRLEMMRYKPLRGKPGMKYQWTSKIISKTPYQIQHAERKDELARRKRNLEIIARRRQRREQRAAAKSG